MRETIRCFLKFLLVPKFSENSPPDFFLDSLYVSLLYTINTLLENNEISELQEAFIVTLSSFPNSAPKKRTPEKY